VAQAVSCVGLPLGIGKVPLGVKSSPGTTGVAVIGGDRWSRVLGRVIAQAAPTVGRSRRTENAFGYDF
jgi:hypothetical protein